MWKTKLKFEYFDKNVCFHNCSLHSKLSGKGKRGKESLPGPPQNFECHHSKPPTASKFGQSAQTGNKYNVNYIFVVVSIFYIMQLWFVFDLTCSNRKTSLSNGVSKRRTARIFVPRLLGIEL